MKNLTITLSILFMIVFLDAQNPKINLTMDTKLRHRQKKRNVHLSDASAGKI